MRVVDLNAERPIIGVTPLRLSVPAVRRASLESPIHLKTAVVAVGVDRCDSALVVHYALGGGGVVPYPCWGRAVDGCPEGARW